MKEQQTCSEWLQQLDQLDPPAEAWQDPDWVAAVSWLMLCFIPRRLAQRVIDAGYATAVPGTDLREAPAN